MSEYMGINATVQVEDDALILTNRGLARNVDGAQRRCIPFGAIADIQFKDAGMTNGFLRLVLGSNGPVDKPGVMKLADDPDTIVFRIGKQAHGLRELHDLLRGVVTDNKRAGIDPAATPYDKPMTADDYLRHAHGAAIEANRQLLTGVRPDIATAAETVVGVEDFLQALRNRPAHLSEGEKVVCLTTGGYGSLRGHSAVLAVTDRQVLLVQDDRLQQRSDAISLARVDGIAYSSGLTGRVEVYSHSRKLVLVAPDATTVPRVVEVLRDAERAERGPHQRS